MLGAVWEVGRSGFQADMCHVSSVPQLLEEGTLAAYADLPLQNRDGQLHGVRGTADYAGGRTSQEGSCRNTQ